MKLSIKNKLSEILASKEGKKILKKHLGEHLNNPMLEQVKGMSIEQLSTIAGDQFPQPLVEAIDRDLQEIPPAKRDELTPFSYGKNEFSSDWLFTKGVLENIDSEGEIVQIPHTWNGLDGQDGGNDYYRNECFYKKDLLVDENYQDKQLYLEFEAANSVAKVYVNGEFLMIHRGGYSTFRVDITKSIKFNELNTIVVSVDNRHIEEIYPLMADFTFMGGLYRKVNLIVHDAIHFDLMDYGSYGVYVSQKNISEEKAVIGIEAKVVNNVMDEELVKLEVNLLNHEGEVLKTVIQDSIIHDKMTFIDELTLENPILWQGVENPYLYTVEFKLFVNDLLLDTRLVKTGLRYYHFDAQKGFFLNGKQTMLNGVSRHQCREDLGWALTEKEQIEDIEIIKEMGANSIRLAHYQHNQFFYDLCDAYGMVIWAEIPYISRTSKTDKTGENAKSQMIELIRQNYNHSSIVTWGVQNEITIAGTPNRTEEIVGTLNKLTKVEDPYRLTTQAQVGHYPDNGSMNNITDIVAYNKYFGWYYNEIEDFDTWLSEFKKVNPTLSLGISEYGCEGILQYHSAEPKKSDYTEEYQALYHEKVLQIFNKHEQLWGTYVWNMFDFASDIRDEGGVKGMNNKGLVTHDRKIRKDSFYWYKANWSTETVLHLTGKRFVDRASDRTWIKVYSNLDEVTLYVNDQQIETLKSDNCVFLFENVLLSEGENNIKVVSGTHEDISIINKVDTPNENYVCQEQEGSFVDNWFDDVELDEDVKPLEFPEGFYSIKDTIEEILENPAGYKVLNTYMKGMMEHAMFDMVKSFNLELITSMQDGIPEALIYTINKELIQIKK